MSGLPVVQILAFSAGVDISDKLHSPAGLRKKWGRGSQFDPGAASTVSFTLDNATGDFTPGNTAGAYYPLVQENEPILVKFDGATVFQGYIDSIEAVVDREGKTWAEVTASDVRKLDKSKLIGAYGIERMQVIAGSSAVIYPLAANAAADASSELEAWRNTAASSATISNGDGGTFEFTTQAPPFLGGSFGIGRDSSLFGPVIEHPTTFNPGAGGAIAVWFRAEDYNSALARMVRTSTATPYLQLFLEGDGSLTASARSDSGTTASVSQTVADFADGGWHLAVVSVDAATGRTLSLHVDQYAAVSTTAAAALTISSTGRRLFFGGYRNNTLSGAGGYALEGAIAGILSSPSPLSNANAVAMYYAGRLGDAGDTIAQRVDKIMRFIYPSGSPTVTVLDEPGTLIMGQDTNGLSLTECMDELADTVRGVYYVDRLGDRKLRGSSARSSATVHVTYDTAADLTPGDFRLVRDSAMFYNRIAASGPAGTFTVEDAGSVTALGPITDPWSSLAYDLPTLAAARLAARMNTEPRMKRITVDLATATTSGVVAATLTLDKLLERVSVTGLHSSLGASTRDGIVEGGVLTVTDKLYTCDLDMGPVE